ncbi:MAG TPA: MarR family transcriptional regulator [Propionibacteriaceae bacterium]|nr:MarR family transcriptional regulator [Propionibacteriaceae bacterium]
MPRPGPERLTPADEVDCLPLVSRDPDDLLVNLEAMVRWADSARMRREIMAAIDFPIDDVSAFLTLNQLVYRGATRPTDIADALGIGRPNVSRIANRLVDEGLIVRVADPQDERGILLALSPEGRLYAERIAAIAEGRVRAALTTWTPAEAAQLTELFARFVGSTIADDGQDLRQFLPDR